MIKRTTPKLAEFIANLLGTPASVERSRSRRLREAGMLSQYGHGRGAAAATSKDAALMLLVSATGIPPLHALAMGKAIAKCTLQHVRVAGNIYVRNDINLEDAGFANTLVDQLAAFIDSGDWQPKLDISLYWDGMSVRMTDENQENQLVDYDLGGTDDEFQRLIPLFGPGSEALSNHYQLDGRAVRELGIWLNGELEVVAGDDNEAA